MFAISHRNRESWPPRSEIPEFKPTQKKKISKAKSTDSSRKRDLVAGITKKKSLQLQRQPTLSTISYRKREF